MREIVAYTPQLPISRNFPDGVLDTYGLSFREEPQIYKRLMSSMVRYHDMSPFSVIHVSSTFSEIRSSGIISVGELTDKLHSNGQDSPFITDQYQPIAILLSDEIDER